MEIRGKLAEGDLRLVALALIAEEPRYGYEVIQLIEEKTAEWYLPSPNIVHPMLAGLAEAGYVTASPEPPRHYAITDAGRDHLEENRDVAATVLNRLTALGERVRRWRRALGTDKRQETVDDSAESLVEILARAAGDMDRKSRSD